MRATGEHGSSKSIVSKIISKHLAHAWTRLQEDLIDYDETLQGLIVDLQSQNTSLRRKLDRPLGQFSLTPTQLDHRNCGADFNVLDTLSERFSARLGLQYQGQQSMPIFLQEDTGPSDVPSERHGFQCQAQQSTPILLQEDVGPSGVQSEQHGFLRQSYTQLQRLPEAMRDDGVEVSNLCENKINSELNAVEPQISTSEVTCKYELHTDWKQGTSGHELSESIRSGPSSKSSFHSASVPERNWSFHPAGYAAVIWHVLFFNMLLYELISFPMKAFPIPKEGFFSVMTWVGAMFWTADLCASMVIGYQTRSGDFVLKVRLIVKHYAKTWLLPDVIMLAVEWIGILVDDSNTDLGIIRAGKYIRSIRVMRALRIVRLTKAVAVFREVECHITSRSIQILSKLTANVALLLLSSHFIACLWYFIGTHSSSEGQGWVNTHLDGVSVSYAYLTSFHWALAQITPGSMEVQPQNLNERVFANATLILGVMIFSSIVSNITASSNRLRQFQAGYRDQIWELRKFCKQENISPSLLCRVVKYADSVIAPRMDTIRMHDVALLKQLPHSIQSDVLREIYDQHFTVHPFFEVYSQRDAHGVNRIYKLISQMAFAEDDVLFSDGQTATAMYFVITGTFSYDTEHVWEEEPETLLPGRWCSEAALWTHWVHAGTLCCQQGGDVAIIDAVLFRQEVQQAHLTQFAINYGSSFINDMNAACGLEASEDEHSGQSLKHSKEPRTISDTYEPTAKFAALWRKSSSTL